MHDPVIDRGSALSFVVDRSNFIFYCRLIASCCQREVSSGVQSEVVSAVYPIVCSVEFNGAEK